mmetsp:Transcript_889/g.1395  ORF Transcript_889/g.1395 Transcript_889/m.1395 type:complete len:154 (-) Transcript_889:277-738(-)
MHGDAINGCPGMATGKVRLMKIGDEGCATPRNWVRSELGDEACETGIESDGGKGTPGVRAGTTPPPGGTAAEPPLLMAPGSASWLDRQDIATPDKSWASGRLNDGDVLMALPTEGTGVRARGMMAAPLALTERETNSGLAGATATSVGFCSTA